MAEPFTVVAGATPLLLVAPHGGRRDPARRPWREGGLKVNDLHTAALTLELAAATGASALVNAALDRNETDLNRITEAAARAPRFLELLAELVTRLLRAHERVTLLTVHGWNVVQASLDVGLGCRSEGDPLAVGARAAVSPDFAATGLARLLAACEARGIDATVGARYPARNAENLVQLFTRRHRDDPRDLVRALAATADRVDAMQLELGIPLRWPGPWREHLRAALLESLPALTAAAGRAGARPAAARATDPAPGPAPRRLEFAGHPLCGLVALDGGAGGGRLLLFAPGGRLLLFTGERAGPAPADGVGPLALRPHPGGASVSFAGPLLEFPDSTPFLDLEAGLARGRLVDAHVALRYDAATAGDGAGFGRVRGEVIVDGARVPVDALGATGGAFDVGPWPRLRVALRLDETRFLRATVALADGTATGTLARGAEHVEVTAARPTFRPAASPLARFTLTVELAGGERLDLVAHAVHRLPVVRIRGTRPLHLEFAACRLGDAPSPAGWCELAGHDPAA